MDDHTAESECSKSFKFGLPHHLNNFYVWEDYTQPDKDGNPRIIKAPMKIEDIYKKLMAHCNNWPKTRGKVLHVLDGPNIDEIRFKATFEAFVLDQGMEIYWSKISGAVEMQSFIEYVKMKAERYESFETLPHYPPMKNVYYHCPDFPKSKLQYQGTFEKLLSFFSPETPADSALLKSFFMTIFWGAPGGRRPAFCLLGPEDDGGRGVGKSTILNIMNKLTFPAVSVDIEANDDREKITKRLLTARPGTRVVRLDNLKKLSNAEIESLITIDYVSGHKMFKGNHDIPNLFTYCLTFNQPEFTEDMAQRSIPIRLARPAYSFNWDVRVDNFVEENKQAIIHDIVGHLMSEPKVTLQTVSRHARWLDEVLSRCTNDPEIVDTIVSRQMDTEVERVPEIEQVIDIIDEHMSRFKFPGGMRGTRYDRDNCCYRAPKSMIYNWVLKEMRGMTANRLTKLLFRHRPHWLRLPSGIRGSREKTLGPKINGVRMIEIGTPDCTEVWVILPGATFENAEIESRPRSPNSLKLL